MPTIELNAKVKINSYITGKTDVNVSKYTFEESSLFIFCEHTPKDQYEIDDIYPFKTTSNNQGTITIKNGENNEENRLLSARVYFNKYDDQYQCPLILLLKFNKNSKAPIRYYKMSEFDKNKASVVNLSNLYTYVSEKQLFDELIDVITKLENFLTYDIGIAKVVNNHKYNNDKISVSRNQVGFGKHTSYNGGFYICTHTPCYVNKASEYKSLITYNGSLLKLKNSSNKINYLEEIQIQNYSSVNVYFGSKASIKDVKRIIEEVPLMIELVKSDIPRQCEYYCHHKNNKDLCWEKLNVSNYEKYTGSKPRRNVVPILSTNSPQILLRLLKRLECYFLQTLVVIINRQEPYTRTNVLESYNDYAKSTIINEDTNLVVQETTEYYNLLKNFRFRVFEHTLSSFKLKHEDYQIKFIIPTIDNTTKYNEITLYNSKYSKFENIEYLSSFEDDYLEDKVQVYFYDKDPRPLLISFGERSYKPKNKDKYSTEWTRIPDFDGYLDDYGPLLLKQLSEVVGFLNEVNLYKQPDYYSTYYELQAYDNDKICIHVSKIHLDCYIEYQHKPKKEQDYRLGNIVYDKDNNKKGNIVYDYASPLAQVNVYYFNNDYDRSYPLLVVLEFQNTGYNSNTRIKKYYKLLQSDFHMEWKIDHVASRIANDSEKLRKYLDLLNYSFNVSELNGVRVNCGHDHSPDPDFLKELYIKSHGSDYFPDVPSSLYTHQVGSDSSHGISNTRRSRSLSSREEPGTMNQRGRHQSLQHVRVNPAPAVSGVEKATRIASTVGTFALAGTGTGVAIYKYSNWIIALFKKIF